VLAISTCFGLTHSEKNAGAEQMEGSLAYNLASGKKDFMQFLQPVYDGVMPTAIMVQYI
jgi:hypothetical protein